MSRYPSPSDSDSSEHHVAAGAYEFKFALNITPSDFPSSSNPSFPGDVPIIPAGDGLLTAPDGSTLTPYSVLELSEKSATTQRRQRKRTHDRNGEYIPRPPNPFILFRCWYTAKVHKPGSHNSSEGSLSRLCGQEWANLGVSQRRIFEEAAKIEKVKHAERYPNYRYKPIHKKGKKTVAAPVVTTAASYQDDQDEEYRPTRPKHRKTVSQSQIVDPAAISHSGYPTFASADHYPLPPALYRHRRSSSVPIGNEIDMLEPSLHPIELPTVPFLALAGQDMPPRRSRGSLGFSNVMFPPRLSQTMQPWMQSDAPLYNYTAMRTSISDIHSIPGTPGSRRAPLSNLHHTQYNYNSHPANFFSSFTEPSQVQWTNPNPFALSSEADSNAITSLHPFAHTLFAQDSSSSSSSAPSPPADLEISPLDQGPGQMGSEYIPPSVADPESGPIQLPFDLNIFKANVNGAMNFGHGDIGRPRGLSILGIDSIDVGTAFHESNYSHALRTEGLVGEIPSHDDMIEQYLHGATTA